MVNALRRAFRADCVTTEYPDVAEPAPLTYRGLVQLLADRCIGDGACARVCPSEAITVTAMPDKGWAWELDDARCVFCGLCAEACPTTAILLSNEFELSVRDRDDLVAQATFERRKDSSLNGREPQ